MFTLVSDLARDDLCGRFPDMPVCSGFISGGSSNTETISNSSWPPADIPKEMKTSPMPSIHSVISLPSSQSMPSIPMNSNTAPNANIPPGNVGMRLARLKGTPAIYPQFGGPINGGLVLGNLGNVGGLGSGTIGNYEQPGSLARTMGGFGGNFGGFGKKKRMVIVPKR